MKTFIAALIALALSGCSLAPSSQVIEALGKDPATVCLTISSVYGVAKFYRTAAPSATVTCNQDGLSVKSNP